MDFFLMGKLYKKERILFSCCLGCRWESGFFWEKKKPDHLSMIGLECWAWLWLAVDCFPEEAALEEDIPCFCIVVVVEEVAHVTRIFLGHDLDTLLDRVEIETMGFRIFIFHIDYDDGSSVVQWVVQMAIDLILIGAEGESLGLNELMDLIPVVAATLESGAEQIGDTIQADLMADAHGDGWLFGWCLCAHNEDHHSPRRTGCNWFFQDIEIYKKIRFFLSCCLGCR